MTVHTLPLGFLQTNCYIAANENRCVIIDPASDAAQVLDFLDEKGLQAEAVLLTHGHFDHVGAARPLATELGCSLYLHRSDCAYGEGYGQWFPLSGCALHNAVFVDEGSCLKLAGMDFSVLYTPGHTQGSVCFRVKDALFAGDTLFAGSIGRTDLAGGDMTQMQESLARLKNLTDDCTVYPGHGPKTTLSREKRVNPYMR